MRQILFKIPVPEWLQSLQSHQSLWQPLTEIPLYGYGLMLFLAFATCVLLSKRLCRREGIDPDLMLDLIIWLFIAGIIGSRIVFIIQYPEGFRGNWWRVFYLMDGGLVFYGGIIGGALGYFAYHHFFLRKAGVSNWKMLDIIAPCIAVGLAFGRVGCLFTGCCFGNLACESCPSIQFPLVSPPTLEMIRRGQQAPLGFVLKDNVPEVEAVDKHSRAEAAGVQVGDVILTINSKHVLRSDDVNRLIGPMQLTVLRNGEQKELPSFEPRSLPLHPTQIYETISMSLLLFFMLSYYPFRRRDGELMVILMFGYGVHRFLNEMLRTDIEAVAFGLTLSQNISLLVLAGGAVLAVLLSKRPLRSETPSPATPQP